MKKSWAITIGREFCSGGTEVARKVAERLSVPYYDLDLIDHAIEKTNLNRETVLEYEEKPESFWKADPYGSKIYRDDPSLVLPVHTRIFEAQCEAIRQYAGEGPAVFVGRCSDYVLDECNHVIDVISVFIRADLDLRVKRCMRLNNLSESEAKKLILKTDKTRAKYYKAHTGRDWGAIDNYTLIVDTGEFGTDGAAVMIEAAVNTINSREKISL